MRNGGNEVVKSANSKRARFRSIWARDPGHACKNENENGKKEAKKKKIPRKIRDKPKKLFNFSIKRRRRSGTKRKYKNDTFSNYHNVPRPEN